MVEGTELKMMVSRLPSAVTSMVNLMKIYNLIPKLMVGDRQTD
jgi:hypothetical protein